MAPPETPSCTDQTTPVSALPVTCAANCCVPLDGTVDTAGVRATRTLGGGGAHATCWFGAELIRMPPEARMTVPMARVVKSVSLHAVPEGGAGRVRLP